MIPQDENYSLYHSLYPSVISSYLLLQISVFISSQLKQEYHQIAQL